MVRVSDAELEVLKVIWNKEEVTSNVIIEEVKKFKWSANTVRTLIRRLQDKGAIQAIEKEGKAYIYKAVFQKEKYRMEETKRLLKKLYHNSASELIWQFCEAGDLTVEELKKLINLREKNDKT